MTFNALVFNQQTQAWLRFTHPSQTLVATHPAEVRDVLDRAEAHAKSGGYAVGFVAYEAAGAFDAALSQRAQPTSGGAVLPLASFGLFDSATSVEAPDAAVSLDLIPTLEFGEFETAFHRIKQHLLNGDCYQVNFTHPLKGEVSAPLDQIFGAMLRGQQSPFGFMLETDDHGICSVSPELFFERVDNRVATEPMKGTRPRGRSLAEDRRMARELSSSIKDRAENLMIVDMVRNDLGRIAIPGTVKVDELFARTAYATVWQQTSRVSAEVNATLSEIFAALFPCASVTGAPKASAMQIINDLESEPRGVYTGALGMVKPGGDARFSVGIRTLVVDKRLQHATYGVGGGIVWDSDLAEEWQESLTKASVLSHQPARFDLLETMRFEVGSGIARRQYHLERLIESAEYFGYPLDIDRVNHTLDGVSAQTDARLRLLVSPAGDIDLQILTLPAAADSLKLTLASAPVFSSNVFLFHKTTHRAAYEAARREKGAADDVILFNERGELTETTIANLYLEIDGELFTPAITAGVLPGTYRRQMISEGRAREATLTVEDLNRAERIWMSNSVRGLVEATLVSGAAL